MTDNPFRSGLNDSPSLYRVPGSNGLVMAPYRVNREGSAGGLLQQHHTIPNNIFGSGVLELHTFWQQMERLGYDQRDPATNRVWTTTDPVEAVRMNIPLHHGNHDSYDALIEREILGIAKRAVRRIDEGTPNDIAYGDALGEVRGLQQWAKAALAEGRLFLNPNDPRIPAGHTMAEINETALDTNRLFNNDGSPGNIQSDPYYQNGRAGVPNGNYGHSLDFTPAGPAYDPAHAADAIHRQQLTNQLTDAQGRVDVARLNLELQSTEVRNSIAESEARLRQAGPDRAAAEALERTRVSSQFEYERETRVSPNNDVEVRIERSGSTPPGQGWVSDTEAFARRPDLNPFREAIEGLREQYRSLLADVANYTPDGKLKPFALDFAKGFERGLGKIGLAAMGIDTVTTAHRIHELNQQGLFEEARAAAAEFAARQAGGWTGGIIGAEVGSVAGTLLGFIVKGVAGAAFGGPIAAIALGILGAVYGADLATEASHWLSDHFGLWFSNRDPLVLSLTGDHVSLTALATSNAYFDLNNDGLAERTGWIARGEALLALDGNHNGRIDGGAELFGNATQTGFEVLAAYDDNRDGQITSADAVWSQLLLWRDANGDGVSSADELSPISASAVTAINLHPRTPAQGEMRAGNPLLAVGSSTGAGGFNAEAVAVAFTTDQTNTRFILPDGFAYDPAVFTLPNLRGYGSLPDLWVAMSLDPLLKSMVQALMAGSYGDISDLVGKPYTEQLSPFYQYGMLQVGVTAYHYRTTAFEDMLARWAGVPLDAGLSNEQRAEMIAERMLGRPILDDRGAGSAAFHDAFWHLSTELATRFVVAWADIAENKDALDLFSDILAASDSGGATIDPAVLQGLIDQAISDAATPPVLSPLLQRYAALNYDFGSDAIGGDIRGFLAAEVQAFEFDPAHPWTGWAEWVAPRTLTLDIVDPDGRLLDVARRAYTGNRMLNIETGPVVSVTGNGIVRGDVGGGILSNIMRGGAGDDVLMGGHGDDAYIFSDGCGRDVVVDSAGNRDEIAFQGNLTAEFAIVSLEGTGRRDLRISFEGRAESVLIRDYFGVDGSAKIERITFPDGPLWDGQAIRDRAFLSLQTSGNDMIGGTVASDVIAGGAGNDVLGFGTAQIDSLARSYDVRSGSDIITGGAGDDILKGYATFRFSRGDGHDLITEAAGSIEFDATITSTQVEIRQLSASALILSVLGTDQTITFDRGRMAINFANGTHWSAEQVDVISEGGIDGDNVLFARSMLLDGGAGNDQLTGNIGNNILIGGRGNDRLSDIFGADEFRFSRGDGHDMVTVGSPQIAFVDSVNTKTIAFDNSITLSALSFAQSANGLGLIIRIAGENQSIMVTDFMRAIDRIQLRVHGGPTLNGRELLAQALAPTTGNDHFVGSANSETISGGAGDDEIIGGIGGSNSNFGDDILEGDAGNDILIGRGGSDTLNGGTGDDVLRGGYGADVHRFARGDGHDVVELEGEGDQIIFENGIAPSDVTTAVSDSGYDLILRVGGADQSITLRDVMFNPASAAFIVRYADGSSTTISNLILASQTATSGDDVINGSFHVRTLSGGGGNDIIRGGTANETIDGGAGNDTYSGGGGINIYRFGIGSGADTLKRDESFGPSQDAVEFGAGIAPENIEISASPDGNVIYLSIKGTSDSLSIERRAAILQNGEFRFDGGVTWTAQQLWTLGFGAGAGNDTIFGGPIGALLEGLDGNDSLFGGAGQDILVGGRGNDFLQGGRNGPDIYRFDRGDGQDRIVDRLDSGLVDAGLQSNILEFGEGIKLQDVAIFNSGGNGVIIFRGTGDRITFGEDEGPNQVFSEIRFADGTRVQPSSIWRTQGSVSGDILIGTAGANTLDGGGFVSQIRGNGGSDTFVFKRGYGEIIIDQTQIGSFLAGQPPYGSTLRLGAGIRPDDINVSSNAAGDLILTMGGGDQVTLLRGRLNAPLAAPALTTSFSGVMHVIFADGTIWSHQDVIKQMYVGDAAHHILIGDSFGGIFDTAGFAHEIFSYTSRDKFLYNQGNGAVRIHIQIPIAEFVGGSAGSNSLELGAGLSLEGAGLRITDDGSLIIDFGGGDIVEFVSALPTDRNATIVTRFDGIRHGNFYDDFFDLVDLANAQTVAVDPGVSALQRGTIFSEAFDPAGVGDIIVGNGGWDEITYERGYGALTIHVAPDLGSASQNRNIAEVIFGTDITADDIVLRAGLPNEIIADLGNGDVIRFLFEHDPGLDLVPRLFYQGAVSLTFSDGSELNGGDILDLLDYNDVPSFGAGSFAANTSEGREESLALAGEFSFNDPDVSDLHVIAVTGLTAQGTASGLPAQDELLSYLFAQISRETGPNIAGQVGWTFAAEAGVFDYLAEGESVSLNYTVTISDGRTGAVQHSISIVVNGTNQAPEIVGGTAGATMLPSNANAGASGQITFADADLSQTHSVSVQSVIVAGNATGLPSIETIRNWINTALKAGDAGTHQLDWSFMPQGVNFGYLGLSDQLSLIYAVQIHDSSGAVTTQHITIVVQASQLAAGALALVGNTVFLEDHLVDLAIPASLFASVIQGNVSVSAGLVDGSALPAWLVFDGARLTGNPPADFSGTLEVRIAANNGSIAVHDYLPLVLLGVNDAPIVGEHLLDRRVVAGAAVNIPVPQNAFEDVDGDSLRLTATMANGTPLPTWLQFVGEAFVGTPPADFVGSLALGVTASDGAYSASQSFNLVIDTANAAPSVANQLYDWQIREDQHVDIALPANAFQDVDNDSLTLSASMSNGASLPAWLQFDGTRFFGTPPANFNGVLVIAVTASDEHASATDMFKLVIDAVNDAPILSQLLADVTFSNDAAFEIAIPDGVFVDPDGDNLSVSLKLAEGGALPTWLSFDGVRLIANPPENFIGILNIVVNGSDGSLSTSDSFTLTVNHVNAAPVVTAPVTLAAVAEDSIAITITSAQLLAKASDADGDLLSVTGLTASSGSLLNNGNGTWSFTPATNDDSGTLFSYGVSDGVLSVATSATLDIIPVNDTPLQVQALADHSSPEDTAINFTLPAGSFSDVDGDVLTLTAKLESGAALPAWLGFDAATRTFSGLPPRDYSGTLSITVIASDGQTSVSDVFSLTITPVNDLPTHPGGLTLPTIQEDGSILITAAQILAGASDPDGDTLTVASIHAAGQGVVTNNGNGTWTFTPAPDFNGSTGLAAVISDGITTIPRPLVLTVTSVNDAPTAVALALTPILEDANTVISSAALLSGATDVDDDTLTVANVTASSGTLTTAGGGNWLFTPALNSNAPVLLGVTISDGTTSIIRSVTQPITPVNDAPIVASTNFSVAEDTTLSTALVSSDPDSPAITYTLVSSTTHGALTFNANGAYNYTPTADYNGLDSFTVRANDGSLDSPDTAISILVTPVNDAPIAAAPIPDQTTAEDALFSYTLPAGAFTDVDSATLTFTASALPSWLSFNATTRTFSGTPTNANVGAINVTVTASDGSLTASDVFAITVTNTNDAPLDLSLSAATVAENAANGTIIGTASAVDPDVGDTRSYGLIDNAGGRFAINATTGVISVVNGTLLNFETATSHAITLRVTDAAGAYYDEVFNIAVSNVNEAPSSLTLASGGTVAENATNGTVVGQLAATDPDASAALSYSLINNAGGRFAVNAATGQITVANGTLLDFETATSHSVTARVTDQGGLTRDLNFAVNLTDVVEGPVLNVINGTSSDDILLGTAGADIISGLVGRDILYGNAGSDILIGGSGADVLWGGAGQDVFRYLATTDALRVTGSNAAANREAILDFNPSNGLNHDIIDLSAIDANTNLAGNQAFIFIGSSAFSGVAGQLRFADGILSGDVNGDKIADIEISILFQSPPAGIPLDVTDFIL